MSPVPKRSMGVTDDKLSFADDQADKTGVDKRTDQRNAERGEKITLVALGRTVFSLNGELMVGR